MKMRMTQVARIKDISPHMRRIVLTGEDLNDFPSNQESAHFKAIFPKPGQIKPKLGLYPGFKKWMRSYTVRAFDEYSKELSVDFAVNDHTGLATNWAINAKVGDYLGVAGPGDIKHTNYHAHWHLFVADLTALPASAATLEKLPRNAIGAAFIQIPTEDDKQLINAPEKIQLNWVINQQHNKNALLEQVEKFDWLDGEPAIFIAAESGQMQAIKKFLKTKPGYTKQQTYASGYWKA